MSKIKTQKGFIQIPLLVWVVIFVIGAGGIGYSINEYSNVSKSIKKAEYLTKEENYNAAVQELEGANNSWLSSSLGIKKQEIASKIENNKKLLDDKTIYDRGIQEFKKQNYGKAKELFSNVSDNYPHYQEAKNKAEEAQNKITEKQITEAVEKFKKEAAKDIEVSAESNPITAPEPSAVPTPIITPTENPLLKIEKCETEAKIKANEDAANLLGTLNKETMSYSDWTMEEKITAMDLNLSMAKGEEKRFYEQYYLNCLNK